MNDKSGGPWYPSEQSMNPDGQWNQTLNLGASARLVIATKLAVAWVAGDAKRKIIPSTVFDTAEDLIAEERRRVKLDAEAANAEPPAGDEVNDGN